MKLGHHQQNSSGSNDKVVVITSASSGIGGAWTNWNKGASGSPALVFRTFCLNRPRTTICDMTGRTARMEEPGREACLITHPIDLESLPVLLVTAVHVRQKVDHGSGHS